MVDGDYVEMGSIEPTVRGNAPYDVPQEAPATVRDSALILHKDQPRNARKANETRATNQLINKLREAAKAPLAETLNPDVGTRNTAIPAIENPTSFLEALADDLD